MFFCLCETQTKCVTLHTFAEGNGFYFAHTVNSRLHSQGRAHRGSRGNLRGSLSLYSHSREGELLQSPNQKSSSLPGSFSVQRCETRSEQKNRFQVINSRPGFGKCLLSDRGSAFVLKCEPPLCSHCQLLKGCDSQQGRNRGGGGRREIYVTGGMP